MKRIIRTTIFSLVLTGALLITGCGPSEDTEVIVVDTTETDMGMGMEQMTAMVNLQPTQGNTAQGMLTFTQVDDSTIQITGQISGLQPGQHGIHVHEFGDCSAPDASSAGGHFNPTGATHAGPDAPAGQRHVGDLGNIDADQNGTANINITDDVIALSGTNSIVGKAVVVHESADDLQTDPSGNSGARVACGVIQMEGGVTGMGMDTDTTTGI